MADPITAADVQAFLGELGYSIPAALLDPILCVVNKIIPCLDGAGYDDCTAKLILMYAAALMATSSGARRIKSQGRRPGRPARSITVTMASPGCATLWRNWIPAAAPVNFRQRWQQCGPVYGGRGLLMAWVSVQQRLPRTFTRVWVITDTGQQTTAYVKSDGEWFINCDRIRATGAVVLRWRDD